MLNRVLNVPVTEDHKNIHIYVPFVYPNTVYTRHVNGENLINFLVSSHYGKKTEFKNIWTLEIFNEVIPSFERVPL